jgi:sigma-B regulation protein RsbU (phosphoserine phosphatase)
MPAALLAMFLKHALVTKETNVGPGGYRLLRPGESIGRLNDALIEQNLTHAAFATAVYGMIDVDTLEITLARAGHPAPLLLRAGGAIEPLEAEGPLLGVFPGETFSDCRATLKPGDRLLLYTDGIEVAFCDDQALDTQRWRQELLSRGALPADQLLTQFADRLDAENGSLEPKDDLTVVIAEVMPD